MRGCGPDRPSALAAALVVALGVAGPRPARAADAAPVEDAGKITYESVDAARSALSLRADVKLSVQNGWMVFDDPADKATWSFVGLGMPPYPSVVKRQIVAQGDKKQVRMSVLCEAPKPACDLLVSEFTKINTEMARRLNKTP